MGESGSEVSTPAPLAPAPVGTSSEPDYVIKLGRKIPRCTATSKQTGRRCGMQACKGTNVCYFHGGAAIAKTKPNAHRLYSKYLSPEEVKIYRKALRAGGNQAEIALLITKVAQFVDRATKKEIKVDQASLEALSQILGRLGNLREQDLRMEMMKAGKVGADGKAPSQVQVNVIWAGREGEVEVDEAEAREIP